MILRKRLANLLKKLFCFEDRLNKEQKVRSYYQPRFDTLEERVTPAVSASVLGNILTVSLSAAADHAFLSYDASNDVRIDDTAVGGFDQGTFAGVNTIHVVDTGAAAGQQATFALGQAFTQNVTVSGIETLDLFQRLNGTVSADPSVVNVGGSGLIQQGVDIAPSGATVNVAAGVFQENVTISKPLTLHGANAGVAGAAPRSAETVVLTNGNQNAVFSVSSSNVVIDGFSIDGDDPSVVGSPLASGDDTNVSYGIRATGAFSHLTIENNIIQHAFIGFRGDGAASSNLITQNWFNSIGNFDFGYGISLRSDFYADITNNVMTEVWTGVHLNNFHNPGGPATWTMSGNEIHSYATGLAYWLQYGSATPLTIDNNQFYAETGAVADNFGVLMVSIQDTVHPTFTNNTINGTDYGVGLTNVSTSNPITLDSSNSIIDTKLAGVYLTDNLTFNPVGTTDLTSNPYTGSIAVALDGVSITGALGDGVKVETSRVSPNVDVSATVTISGATTISGSSGAIGIDIEGALAKVNVSATDINGFGTGIQVNSGALTVGANTTISDGTTGLGIDGSTASITGDTLANLSFTGQTGAYILLSNGALFGHTLDATSATFDGTTGATATLAQNLATEDKITHAVDDATLGFVRVRAGNVYVTQASGSIQRGINAALPGETVHVGAGTYAENNNTISISKSVTLLGPNSAVSPNTGVRGAEAVITTLGSNLAIPSAFSIDAGHLNVTIQGFEVDGTTPINDYQGQSADTLRNNIFKNITTHGMFFEAPTLILDNNRFTGGDYGSEDSVQVGVDAPAVPPASVTITNNVWTGVGTAALNLSDVSGTISGNQFLGSVYYGILVAGASGNLNITSNLFDGITNPDPSPLTGSPTWGAGVRFYAPSITNPVHVTGNTFQNSYIGVSIRAGADITGMPIDVSGNTFTNDGQAIYQDGAGTLDITAGNIFDGVDSTTATLAQLFTIADSIHDGADEAGKGLVRVRANNVYVTQASGSIERGITVASPGDTVNVAAGTFTDNIVLDKQVTLRGAQSGVDARGRSATESIVTPLNPTIRTLELVTGAAGAVIDGFTFSGGSRAIESTSGPLDNLQILNNRILAFTDSGIFLNDSGSDITIDKNVVDGSSKITAGDLVHLDTDTFNGFYLTNNNIVNGATATGFFVDGNHNVAPSLTRNPLISGNLISGNNTGMNLGSRSFGSPTTPNAGTISDNTFANNILDGLQAGIQNVLVTQNTFTGNARWGLNLTSFGNAGTDRGAQNSMITQNVFSSNGVAGSPNTTGDVVLSATQAPGTISTNVLFDNSFRSTTALVYNGTETINASGNWWGSATGPTLASHPTGTGHQINGTGAANIDFTPWLNLATEDPATGASPGFQGDFSSLSVDDDSPQIGAVSRINEAIGLLADGSLTGGARTVNVLAGAYSDNVIINKALTLSGAGSGNTAGDTVIDAGGAIGIDLQWSNTTVQNLRVQNGANGVYSNATISNVVLTNVASVGNSNAGFEVHNSAVLQNLTLTNNNLSGNSIGFRVATTGVVNGLNVSGGHFDNNTSAGLYTNANSSSTTNQNSFTNITIDGTTFSNNGNKGIYVEVLDHATIKNIQVIDSGTTGSGAAGIDVNLKFGTYSNLSFLNDTITDSGTGAAAGAGLTIKARGDSQDSSSYIANPAQLTTLSLTNVTVSGSPVDLALGDNIVLNTVTMSGVSLGGVGRGLVLYENSDASPGQTLNAANTSFAGTLAAYIEETSAGTALNATAATFNGTAAASLTVASAYSVVDKILDAVDLGSAAAGIVRIQAGQMFVTPNSFSSPTTTTPSIQRGIDAALSGDTLHVQAGTYAGNVSSPGKAITLDIGASPGQVTLNGDFTLDANDTFVEDITNYTAGSGYDQLIVNGAIALGSATLVVHDTLANPVTLGSVFRIIDNDLADPVTGTFTIPGSTIGPDGVTRFVANTHTYESYTNFGTAPGNGNDVVLRLDFNDPPVNTVPGIQAIAQDTSLVFSTANGNAISIADPDAGSASVQITLHVSHGVLTLASGFSGLTFLTGDGTADATMIIQGSIANLNTALNGLTYAPTAHYSGGDILELTTDDLGHTGPDGPKTTLSAVNIAILNTVNDPPVVPNRTLTTREDNAIAGVLTASDPENDPVTFSVVQPLHGVVTFDSATGDFTYTPNANYNGADSFTYQASDGVNLSNVGTVSITVNSVNDAPAGADKTVAMLENAVYTFTAADFGFSDPNDTPANAFLQVMITTLPAAGSLQLNGLAVNPGEIVTKTNIDAGKLTFTPAANANGVSYANFTFQVQDDGGTANGGVDLDQSPNTITVNVTAVNHAPAGADKTVTTLEDTSYTFTAADFGFSDPLDSPANAFSAVIITLAPTAGSLKNDTTLLSDGASVSVADINAGKLVFTPAPNANGSAYASFTFQVQDDGTGANLDLSPNTMTINVTAVNDAPVLGGTVGGSYSQGSAALTLVIGATVSDPDAAAFSTGSLTAKFAAYQPGDVIAVNNQGVGVNQIGVSGANVTFNPGSGAVTIGAFTGGNAADLVITLNANATQTAVQALLGQLQYSSTSLNPTNFGTALTRDLTITLNDGGNSGTGGPLTGSLTGTVNVTGVNAAPVLANGSSLLYTENDGPKPINTTISVSDANNTTLASATVAITAFVANQDVLAFTNVPATMGNIQATSNVGGVLTLTSAGASATLAQWQAALRSVTYENTSGNPTTNSRTVTFVVNDGVAASNAINSTINLIAITGLAAPTPTSPTGVIAAGANFDTPTFTWTSVAGADHYYLYVIDQTANMVVINNPNVSGTSFATPVAQALTPGHSFVWFIGTVSPDHNGTITFSTEQTFDLAALAAPALIGTSGTIAAADGYDMPTFSWTAVPGANHYYLAVFDNSGGAVVNLPNVGTATSYTLSAAQALTPGHSYTWYVFSISTNAMAFGYAPAGQTFTLANLPGPVLSGPSGTIAAAAGYDMPTFTWNSAAGADHYYLAVIDNMSQIAVVNLPNVGKVTTYTLSAAQALTPGHSYTWYVFSFSTNGKAYGYQPPGLSFTLAALAAPTLNAPSGTIVGTPPSFNWGSVPGADHYYLYVVDITTGKAVIDQPNLSGTSFTPTAPLISGHRYTWFVFAVSTNDKAFGYLTSGQDFVIA